MKVLVTGATGFIGGHVARALQQRGDDVRLLVRPSAKYAHLTDFELAMGDLADPASLQNAMRGVEQVFHIAAVRDRWDISYEQYRQVNVEGTENLLKAAASQGSKFLYCSSVGVMGYPNRLNIDETFPYATGDGKYNYSHTKGLADAMTLEYAAGGRLWASVVRPVITYGPGDDWGMVTRLIDMLYHHRFMAVGNGRNHLHLAYVSDVVAGFLLAMDTPEANGRAYIIAGPQPITPDDLVAKICRLMEISPPRLHIPANLARLAGWGMEAAFTAKRKLGVSAFGDVPFITRDKVDTLAINRSFSTARAEAELGYRPAVNDDDGLQKTVDWWCTLENHD